MYALNHAVVFPWTVLAKDNVNQYEVASLWVGFAFQDTSQGPSRTHTCQFWGRSRSRQQGEECAVLVYSQLLYIFNDLFDSSIRKRPCAVDKPELGKKFPSLPFIESPTRKLGARVYWHVCCCGSKSLLFGHIPIRFSLHSCLPFSPLALEGFSSRLDNSIAHGGHWGG